jgi:tetratricopeptide (TPR) repeat protein
MKLSSGFNGTTAALALSLAFSALNLPATDSNPPAPSVIEVTNAQEVMRAYLQLQEQLHLTQLAVEQNRKEARDATVQAAEALANRLQGIEQALASQRARELDSMQSTNRVMLIVAGSFATLGFVAMLLMAYFQWRTVNGLAEISAALPMSRALGAGTAMAALGPGDSHLVAGGPAEQSNLRLLGAMEQLEKRLHDLEHTSRPPATRTAEPSAASTNGNEEPASANGSSEVSPRDVSGSSEGNRVSMLLGKGQSMLHLDDAEGAIACFDEALALEPNNTETLVKKGAALERLQRLSEAIECYDRAIAADGSMTIAYLHKGGLFNRMERFNEALECYEKALRTQEKREV